MDMKTTYRTFLPSPRRHQSGLALIVALIALVAMTLAGLALMRSVDTNALIASNIAFRQSTRESTDAGIEAARDWLLDKAKDTSSTTLESNSAGNGYYAIRTGIDLTGNTGGPTVKWLDNNRAEASDATFSPACLATDTAGNVVCYVIQRMCKEAGPFDIKTCDAVITDADGTGGTTKQRSTNSLDLSVRRIKEGSGGSTSQAGIAVYRVTVRAAGPRNNFSYVQAFITLPGVILPVTPPNPIS
jgi:Tfp pilus assembly protein PilX